MQIYVGNLPYSATAIDVRDAFAAHGDVHGVKIVTDRETGKSRGFGFVRMDDEQARKAISALNETDLGGRTIYVREAEDRRQRR